MSKKTSPFIPAPPHPLQRREKLPWQRAKPRNEDEAAPARVKTLLSSESYRQADEDINFLRHDESRGLRLQLDYSKAQRLLEQHDIHHTVVIFGGTRVVEPPAARHKVETLHKALLKHPDDRELKRQMKVARRVLAKSHFYDVARELGRLIGDSGSGPKDCRLVVMTGGGPGIMEAANRGASDAGAKTIGLNITLPHEQYPNPYITPELCFRFHYFALRKMHFLMRARALVAFPGGLGTLDELFETLTLIQTRKIAPLPVILVGADYWGKVFDFDFLVAEGVVDSEDRDLFWFAETAQEVWEGILCWHENNGTPLFG